MNRIDREAGFGDDHRFDLLVDGELGEAERGELLAGLDDEPGGWRQCALAFLQAQALREDLGSILQDTPDRPVARRPIGRGRSGGYGRTLLAMAASFLVALLLGTQLDRLLPGPDAAGGRPTEVAKEPADKKQPAAPPGEMPESMLVEVPESARSPQSPSQPVGMVELAGPFGQAEPMRVPVIERDGIDEEWLRGLPAAVPPKVLRQWERIGRVRQHRRLVPFWLEDGRQLVVPVDELDVHYVGRPAL